VPYEFDFKVFIKNICASDRDRTASMESTIGYLMHGYKNLAYSPATIFNDEVISDNPEGGTGKGIIMNAIGKLKKVAFIDGKTFQFDRFSYQGVAVDTQIICFDDVKKHFEFERLFSVVTEGISIEKKNMDSIRIPFNKSPKIAITTNYAIKGAGNSFARRKWELELHQYYSRDRTPIDEFGRMMFGDWDVDDWCAFDNYMIGCLMGYISTGLVRSRFVNLNIRQLSAETTHEFIEWCGIIGDQTPNPMLAPGCMYYKNDLYYNFISEYPDYGPKSKMTISRSKFYSWLSSYAMYKFGVPPEDGRDSTGRWLRFREREEIIDALPVIQNTQARLAYPEED
jgi:hypothetical protein